MRYTTNIRKAAYMQATAADSVAVKKPEVVPPRMIRGRMITGRAFFRDSPRSPQVVLGMQG